MLRQSVSELKSIKSSIESIVKRKFCEQQPKIESQLTEQFVN